MNVLEISGVEKKYPGVVANQDVSLQVREASIHAIIGENGAGKSTLMKILYGLIRPDAGSIRAFGNEVNLKSPQDAIALGIGMVHQHFKLADNATVLENVILGSEPTRFGFLVKYDEAREKLKEISKNYGLEIDPDESLANLGVGERQRVEIAKVLFRGAKILILDEPTNDLDLPTLAVLEQFLIDFAGCVLLVSHDRYFMDKLVDHLFIFEGDGVIRDYPGNYTQYRILEKSNQSLASLSSDITSAKEFDAKKGFPEIAAPATTAINKKGVDKMTFKEKHELDTLNKTMPELESKKEALTNQLNVPNLDYNEIIKLSEQLGILNNELEAAELRWLELSEKQQA